VSKFKLKGKVTLDRLLNRVELADIVREIADEKDAGNITQIVTVYSGDKGINYNWAAYTKCEALGMLEWVKAQILKEFDEDT